MAWRVVVVLAVASCVGSSSVECDGYLCPVDTLCDTANGGCVLPEQLQTCNGLMPGADCPIAGRPGGFCRNGVCVASRCGDGEIRGSERCDGSSLDNQTCSTLGYYNAGDVTCTSDCVFDTSQCGGGKCGDHTVQADHEFCEDGNAPTELSCLDFGFDLGRLGCAPTCQPDFGACEHFGFFPVITNTTTALRSVWGTSSGDLYIASDGALRHFDGDNWTTIDLGTTEAVLDVSGTGVNDVWAVGDHNTVHHYDGTSWTTTVLQAPSDYELDGVWAVAPDDVFVSGGATDGSAAYFGIAAHWDGATWTIVGTADFLYDIWASGPGEAYAASEVGNVYHWDGAQWTPTTLGAGTSSFFTIWGTSANDVWVVGQEVFHHTASGWTQVAQPTGRTALSVTGAGGRVYIGTNEGVLVFDGGESTLIPTTQYNWMWAAGKDDVWAISPLGAVRRFTGRAWLDDGNTMTSARAVGATSATYAVVSDTATPTTMRAWDGATWTTLPTCPINSVQAIFVAAKDDIFAVGPGASHYVADTPTGTPYWHAMSGSIGTLFGVWGRSSTDVFAVGSLGRIQHWDGNTWTQMTSNTSQSLRAVWGTSTDVFAVGIGDIVHYDGNAWAPMTVASGTPTLLSVWGTASNNVYAGGAAEFLHWDGATWTVQLANIDSAFRSISGNGPDDIYAVGSLGGMAHFDGVSWSPVRVPTTQSLTSVAATPTRIFVAGSDGTQLLMLP